MRPQFGIVFDLDDTLYRTRCFVLSGFRAVAHHLQTTCRIDAAVAFRIMTGSLRAGHPHVALQRCCEEFGLDERHVSLLLHVLREHEPSLRLPRTSRQLLDACRPLARIGVLTNGDPAMQQRKIHALGLPSHVDAVVYAHAHHPEGKPARAAFDAMHAALGTPRDMTMVGDSRECDVEGALRAGWRAVWLAPAATKACHDVPSSVICLQRLAEFVSVAENMWGEAFSRSADDHRPTHDRS